MCLVLYLICEPLSNRCELHYLRSSLPIVPISKPGLIIPVFEVAVICGGTTSTLVAALSFAVSGVVCRLTKEKLLTFGGLFPPSKKHSTMYLPSEVFFLR